MKSFRCTAMSLLGLGSATCFASESSGSKAQFAMGTPLWVLGFAIVIALVFILIPICSMLFKCEAQVEE